MKNTTKFVMATYLPDESDDVKKEDVFSLIQETFPKNEKDVVLLDLKHMNLETLNKFISIGGIDCFIFTPETLSTDDGKSVISNVIRNELEQKRNTHFLDIYNGNNHENVEIAIQVGELLLKDEFRSKLSHLDVNTNSSLFSQNLIGMKNDAIKNRQKFQEKDKDIVELASSIVNQIEKDKDQYTADHIRSVSVIAEAIANKMNLGEYEIEILKIGALLHDVGKQDVSDSVLKKPARLTDDEFIEMRAHTSFGEVELNRYDFGIYERAKIVSAEHHERYDGRGYPRGLKGEELDVLARIVSISDATQAMFGRNYQKGKNKTNLVNILKEESGKQFDPKMVDILCEILEKEPESIYVSYDENGNINYKVPSTEELLNEAYNSREERANDFFNSLKEDVEVIKKENESNNVDELKNDENQIEKF